MNTRSFLSTTALALATAITLNACSSDDSNDNNSSGGGMSSGGGASSPSGGNSSSGGEGEPAACTQTSKIQGEPVTYEGETYPTVVICGQTWFAKNLNVDVEGSKCYNNCTTYGRLYDWATAMNLSSTCNSSICASQVNAKHQGICPQGWHLPSTSEWSTLTSFDFVNSGTKLKATSGWNSFDGTSGNGTDVYGFTALPGGSGGFNASNNFIVQQVGNSGHWWTANELNEIKAYSRFIDNQPDKTYVRNDNGDKESFRSIRCIKD